MSRNCSGRRCSRLVEGGFVTLDAERLVATAAGRQRLNAVLARCFVRVDQYTKSRKSRGAGLTTTGALRLHLQHGEAALHQALAA